jgi:2-polyprenyl-6-methoxyphenol hydroxylase-like FAD-dependent oxidoreductase
MFSTRPSSFAPGRPVRSSHETASSEIAGDEKMSGQDRCDLIVVGGGVAGSATAATMARAGARVLVLERDTAFRDRVRGEWLAPWGVGEARRLGLLDTFARAGAHELPALAGRSLKPRSSRSPEGDAPLTFSHPALQEALLASAAEAGARVVRGAKVTSVGPREAVYATNGASHTATARLLVGADGRSSLARKALGKEERVHRAARLLAGVLVGGLSIDPSFGYFILDEEAGGVASLFPQSAEVSRAYVMVEGNDASPFAGKGGFERFIAAATAMGVPAEAFAGARQDGPLGSFVADDIWIETPAAPGLALIGDAAGISDPTWGMGLALGLRDARVLSQALIAERDWDAAVASYAAERDRYFAAVVAIENWESDLYFAHGAEADRRRKHAMRLWSKEPGRYPDLPGLGPLADTSEEARRRFYGEDVPMEVEAPVVVAMPAGDSRAVGQAFREALVARDFEALEQLLGPRMRTRMLLPTGAYELSGSGPTLDTFRGWFEHVDDFAPLSTSQDEVGDRLKMSWRFELRWPGELFLRVIEQNAYAKVVDGRIVVLDLLCSGFRPLEAAA